jgi:hypothetical protein
MKNKLGKLFRFGIALFAMGLFLTNCEKDNTTEEPILVENQEPSLKVNHISKETI